MIDLGFVDVFRQLYDAGDLFSWWDYRNLAFPKGRGMRIDLVLASPVAAAALDFMVIDRNERKGEQPSDHAPVVADFALS